MEINKNKLFTHFHFSSNNVPPTKEKMGVRARLPNISKYIFDMHSLNTSSDVKLLVNANI